MAVPTQCARACKHKRRVLCLRVAMASALVQRCATLHDANFQLRRSMAMLVSTVRTREALITRCNHAVACSQRSGSGACCPGKCGSARACKRLVSATSSLCLHLTCLRSAVCASLLDIASLKLTRAVEFD